jgi:hypothetical protein
MEELEIEGYEYLWDISDGLQFLATMQKMNAFEIISDTDEMWNHFTGEEANGRTKEEKVDQHETGR